MTRNDIIFKEKVAKSFNRAATLYNEVAAMQKKVGYTLFNNCPPLPNGQTILDLGCGTGMMANYFKKQNINHRIIAIDLAENMLLQSELQHHMRLCADADYLPLQANQVDLVISNLALQWLPNLALSLQEIKRVLTIGGKCFFSTMGPATLFELRECWEKIDDAVHINHFLDATDIKKILNALHFCNIQIKTEMLQFKYPSVYALMKKLKQTGAHNVNLGQPKSLLGKKTLKQLYAHYENYRDENKQLPASYEIIYITCEKQK